jgi:hypothetical protein
MKLQLGNCKIHAFIHDLKQNEILLKKKNVLWKKSQFSIIIHFSTEQKRPKYQPFDISRNLQAVCKLYLALHYYLYPFVISMKVTAVNFLLNLSDHWNIFFFGERDRNGVDVDALRGLSYKTFCGRNKLERLSVPVAFTLVVYLEPTQVGSTLSVSQLPFLLLCD